MKFTNLMSTFKNTTSNKYKLFLLIKDLGIFFFKLSGAILSSGHRTGKGQFSFQSQRKAIPKNVQTTTHLHSSTSLVAQRVKRLPSTQENWVRSLGGEDALEKEMATLSSILPWKTPWMEKPGGLQSMESQRVGHD